MSRAAEDAAAHRPGPALHAGDRYARVAWVILGTAFLVFCLLCAGGLYAAIRYGEHAYTMNTARLQIAHGTKLEVRRVGLTTWELVPPETRLNEGDSVRTGQDTDALIQMFDGSTIQLYYNSTVTLKVMRTSRFLSQFKDIQLVQQGGSIKAEAAAAETYAAMKFHVFSGDGQIVVTIPASSAALITVPDPPASNLRMTVSTQVGAVSVRDNGLPLSIPIGRQRRIFADDIVFDEEPAAAKLINNGDFKADPNRASTDFAPGWRFVQSRPALDALHIYSDVVSETLGGQLVYAARFARTAATTTDLAKFDVRQEMDQPVNYYRTLKFQASVKVADPQTPTGAFYPLTLIVLYEDVDGNSRTWERSFFAQDGPLPAFDPAALDRALVPASWALLPPEQSVGWDLMAQSPQPARIKAVDISVTGYSFNVYVGGLQLTGQ